MHVFDYFLPFSSKIIKIHSFEKRKITYFKAFFFSFPLLHLLPSLSNQWKMWNWALHPHTANSHGLYFFFLLIDTQSNIYHLRIILTSILLTFLISLQRSNSYNLSFIYGYSGEKKLKNREKENKKGLKIGVSLF